MSELIPGTEHGILYITKGSNVIEGFYYGGELLWPPYTADDFVFVTTLTNTSTWFTIRGITTTGTGTINWGDGSSSYITGDTVSISHQYTLAGSYTVSLSNIQYDSTINTGAYYFMPNSSGIKIYVTQWGNILSGMNNADYMFYGSWTYSIPSVFTGWDSVTSAEQAFAYTRIIAIDTFTGLESLTDATGMFTYSQLKRVSSFAGLTSLLNAHAMFDSCGSLTTVTTALASLANVTSTSSMFGNCTALTSNIYAMYMYLKGKSVPVTSYSNTFDSCTAATGYALVPTSWK